MTKTIELNRETRDYIQSLQYEVDARKDIIAFMIDRGMDINSETFKKYQKEFAEFLVQYNTAKDEISNMYVIPTLQENEKVTWSLDFETSIITVTSVE